MSQEPGKLDIEAGNIQGESVADRFQSCAMGVAAQLGTEPVRTRNFGPESIVDGGNLIIGGTPDGNGGLSRAEIMVTEKDASVAQIEMNPADISKPGSMIVPSHAGTEAGRESAEATARKALQSMRACMKL